MEKKKGSFEYPVGMLAAGKRRVMTDSILQEMDVRIEERPHKTMFGSTDRKTYTVEVVMVYLDEKTSFFCEVSPWLSDQSGYIDSIKEKAMHKFAEEIYSKLYEKN